MDVPPRPLHLRALVPVEILEEDDVKGSVAKPEVQPGTFFAGTVRPVTKFDTPSPSVSIES
jgi:hypothetical protein